MVNSILPVGWLKLRHTNGPDIDHRLPIVSLKPRPLGPCLDFFPGLWCEEDDYRAGRAFLLHRLCPLSHLSFIYPARSLRPGTDWGPLPCCTVVCKILERMTSIYHSDCTSLLGLPKQNHRHRGLNNSILFSQTSGSYMSKIKVSAVWVSSVASLSGM